MGTLIAQTPAVTIRQRAVSSMDNNVYVLTSRVSGQQILVDAADDVAAIKTMIAESGHDAPVPCVALIVSTHRHADHVRALAALAEATHARTVAGADDAAAITRQTGVTMDELVSHGDAVGVAGLRLDVVGLRGHTPGSIALAYVEPGQPVWLFTGDSLFPGGVGNTDGDPSRFAQLLGDVTTRIFDVYGDDTVVLPGHGRATTLGAERPHLGEWQARGW